MNASVGFCWDPWRAGPRVSVHDLAGAHVRQFQPRTTPTAPAPSSPRRASRRRPLLHPRRPTVPRHATLWVGRQRAPASATPPLNGTATSPTRCAVSSASGNASSALLPGTAAEQHQRRRRSATAPQCQHPRRPATTASTTMQVSCDLLARHPSIYDPGPARRAAAPIGRDAEYARRCTSPPSRTASGANCPCATATGAPFASASVSDTALGASAPPPPASSPRARQRRH